MFNKVLVPLDGSPYSECVLDHVKTIASGCQVPEVILLFVVEPMHSGVYDLPPDFLEDLKKKNADSAKGYVNPLSNELNKDGMSSKAEIAEGNPAEVILDYTKANGIDLIIMSTHGRSGITRWAIGSTTDRVVRESPVPVLMVTPPGCRAREAVVEKAR